MQCNDGCTPTFAYEEFIVLLDTQAAEIHRQREDLNGQLTTLAAQREQLHAQAAKIENWDKTITRLRQQVEDGRLPAEAAVTQITQRFNFDAHGLAGELISRRPGSQKAVA